MQLLNAIPMNRSFVSSFLTKQGFEQADLRGNVWQRAKDSALATVESYTKRFPTIRIYIEVNP